MFGGSGSSAAPESQQQESAPQSQHYQPMHYNAAVPGTAASCEADAKAFTKCLEVNNNDMNVCQWYLEQLKACQTMSAQF